MSCVLTRFESHFLRPARCLERHNSTLADPACTSGLEGACAHLPSGFAFLSRCGDRARGFQIGGWGRRRAQVPSTILRGHGRRRLWVRDRSRDAAGRANEPLPPQRWALHFGRPRWALANTWFRRYRHRKNKTLRRRYWVDGGATAARKVNCRFRMFPIPIGSECTFARTHRS